MNLRHSFFCVGNFVSLIDTKQRERVRASWLERVPEFESLLGEGYGLGEAIHESLPGDLPVTIQYSVNEGYALPVVAKRKQILLALPRSLQTCIGLCGDTPTTVSQVDDDEQLDEPNSANVRNQARRRWRCTASVSASSVRVAKEV